uniref:Uncharacterized protein n=1 Tax=Glossina brevipalpis TaxID=37001 RepID=A0A1A9WJ47_9MUSC
MKPSNERENCIESRKCKMAEMQNVKSSKIVVIIFKSDFSHQKCYGTKRINSYVFKSTATQSTIYGLTVAPSTIEETWHRIGYYELIVEYSIFLLYFLLIGMDFAPTLPLKLKVFVNNFSTSSRKQKRFHFAVRVFSSQNERYCNVSIARRNLSPSVIFAM